MRSYVYSIVCMLLYVLWVVLSTFCVNRTIKISRVRGMTMSGSNDSLCRNCTMPTKTSPNFSKHINSENSLRKKIERFKQDHAHHPHHHHEPLLHTISSFQEGLCIKGIFPGNWNLSRGGGASHAILTFPPAQSNLQNG